MSLFPQFQLGVQVDESVSEESRQERPARARRRWRFKIVIWSGWLLIMSFLGIAILSYLTNPFAKFSIVKDEFAVEVRDGQLEIVQTGSPVVKDTQLTRTWAFTKAGYHMLATLVDGGEKISGSSVDEIIAEIHRRRFSPDLPFLISGDHFSLLYPRSLGIFYHSILDPRTALSAEDWQHRQAIYLKTLAFALAVFDSTDRLSTTIVPLGPQGVVLMNIYAPPSDTLYSLLYGLRVMQDSEVLIQRYPTTIEASSSASLQTVDASRTLVAEYKPSLQRHFLNYWAQFYDPVTGLGNREIVLSGTKDSLVRHGAFYDNVIAWRTHQLAQELGVIAEDPAFLEGYKQRILQAFWLDSTGYFREEQGLDGNARPKYSSDWLIAYQTGFLSPQNPEDRKYLEAAVSYIRDTQLDQPFGLRFTFDPDISKYYWPVKWGTPDYVTDAIWSHWGMEYTKLLAHLGKVTGDEKYQQAAEHQIEAYSKNILENQGFPELYTSSGELYKDRFYRSVRATGWVVNFELAKLMVQQ